MRGGRLRNIEPRGGESGESGESGGCCGYGLGFIGIAGELVVVLFKVDQDGGFCVVVVYVMYVCKDLRIVE